VLEVLPQPFQSIAKRQEGFALNESKAAPQWASRTCALRAKGDRKLTWITPLRERWPGHRRPKASSGPAVDRTAHQRPRAPGGRPRLAKTLALKTLANCISVQFKRLQFTPDSCPADIVGTMIYSPQDGESDQTWADIQQSHPGGRDQSCTRKGPKCAPGWPCRTPGHHCDETHPLPTPFLVWRRRPSGTRRYLPSSGGADRPVLMKVIVDFRRGLRSGRARCDGDHPSQLICAAHCS